MQRIATPRTEEPTAHTAKSRQDVTRPGGTARALLAGTSRPELHTFVQRCIVAVSRTSTDSRPTPERATATVVFARAAARSVRGSRAIDRRWSRPTTPVQPRRRHGLRCHVPGLSGERGARDHRVRDRSARDSSQRPRPTAAPATARSARDSSKRPRPTAAPATYRSARDLPQRASSCGASGASNAGRSATWTLETTLRCGHASWTSPARSAPMTSS